MPYKSANSPGHSLFLFFIYFQQQVFVKVCVCAVYACRCLYFKMKLSKSGVYNKKTTYMVYLGARHFHLCYQYGLV